MKLKESISECTRCRLHKTRTNSVPGEGPYDAQVVFIGEGPGKKEDQEGRPFVGRAGELLNDLLSTADLSREKVFITNVVKCRPPGNRDPRKDEKEACEVYLIQQLDMIKPKVVCTLGNHATAYFLGSAGISKKHGMVFKKNGLTIVPLYHPAAALYNPNLKTAMEEDFRFLGSMLRRK
ncbi:MAG: uracil-DNA glycosylase [Thermoplasmata archaeon]